MQTDLLISSIKRFKKDDLIHVLKKIHITPNGDIRLTKIKPSKVVDSLFYDWGIVCTNCGEDTNFQVPRGITGIEYVANLNCLACGCKYDTYYEDSEPLA
jgi:hypothetical protein